ncbi:MAG: hypothetical protein HKN12_11540 [Gemmatimonadetes bacterium]|nr:hypothetical protein [Gemmatimonadota bacterium]
MSHSQSDFLPRNPRGSFGRSLLVGLGTFGCLFLFDVAVFTSGGALVRSGAGIALTLLFFLIGGPFLAGYATGVLALRRPVRAAVFAFFIWGAAFVVLDAVASTDPGEWMGVGAALAVVSLPMAGLGAWVGARSHRPALPDAV